MLETFQVFPVGVVRKNEEGAWIEIFEPYSDALLGLEGFSHIQVFFWFHENDTADRRKTLRVHPRKDKKNPLKWCVCHPFSPATEPDRFNHM